LLIDARWDRRLVTPSVGERHDGPGIDSDDRERIFDVGYTDHEDGTGFGLPIVRRIADAHGWSIRLTEGSAGGARFEIRPDGAEGRSDGDETTGGDETTDGPGASL
jgi:two-component system OmpR family sensor kinase